MKSLVRPELPTASACSSQATSAAVDNSAPVQTRPYSLIYRGLAVQTNRATSNLHRPAGLHGCWCDQRRIFVAALAPEGGA